MGAGPAYGAVQGATQGAIPREQRAQRAIGDRNQINLQKRKRNKQANQQTVKRAMAVTADFVPLQGSSGDLFAQPPFSGFNSPVMPGQSLNNTPETDIITANASDSLGNKAIPPGHQCDGQSDGPDGDVDDGVRS